MHVSRRGIAAAILSLAAFPMMSVAAIYSDDFNAAADSANYNVFQTLSSAGGNTSTAVFGFDYSTLGIPSAPNTLGDSSTTGLRVQSDDTAATASSFIIGNISVVTKGLVLPSTYKLSVEVWANYVGGTTINDVNGSNSSTGPTIGIGSAGTNYDGAVTNAAQGGVLVDAIRDATASGGTYRAYINGTNEGNTTSFPNGFYAAGDDSTAGQYTTADKGGFYAKLFPAVTAPAAQSSVATTQTGSTPAGVFGFAWHNETLTQDGTNVTWAIDGTTIATIPDTAFTSGGSQIALGDQDGNTGTGPTTYNFDIFDDLAVTAIPEPASLSIMGLGALALAARRRKTA